MRKSNIDTFSWRKLARFARDIRQASENIRSEGAEVAGISKAMRVTYASSGYRFLVHPSDVTAALRNEDGGKELLTSNICITPLLAALLANSGFGVKRTLIFSKSIIFN